MGAPNTRLLVGCGAKELAWVGLPDGWCALDIVFGVTASEVPPNATDIRIVNRVDRRDLVRGFMTDLSWSRQAVPAGAGRLSTHRTGERPGRPPAAFADAARLR